MRNLLKFDTASSYESYIGSSNFVTPNISLIEDGYTLHYNSYVAPVLGPPTFMSILWEDSNGNLSYSNNVLPTSDGKTPIGLCIAPTGFFGQNEPARWMSLKLMSETDPENGTVDTTKMLPISDKYGMYANNTVINKWYKDAIYTDEYYSYDHEMGFISDNYDNQRFPQFLNQNNEWNLSAFGNINETIITDISGKTRCNAWLTDEDISENLYQTTWETDNEILYSDDDEKYNPIGILCCLRYHTIGTNSGDWYLGAAGEMAPIAYFSDDINSKLIEINNLYPSYCIQYLYTTYKWNNELNVSSGEYFTSTRATDYYDGDSEVIIQTTLKNLSKSAEVTWNTRILALLQYDF